MAQYDSILGREDPQRVVKIVATEQAEEKFTVYVIQVCLHQYRWTVRHRYSEFRTLHEKLVESQHIPKNLLPPKKIFGNQTDVFIQRRRAELEAYLQTILCQLSDLPFCFQLFLDFPKYEIHGIIQNLAEELFTKGEYVLQNDGLFNTTPLQLYALTERLKLPEPPCDTGDCRKDLTNIVDFVSQVGRLCITGSDTAVGTSNIVPNQLQFNLSPFKVLKVLAIDNCTPTCIGGVENLRKSVVEINISKSLQTLKDILLCDMIHWVEDSSLLQTAAWSNTKSAIFSNNRLAQIDQAVKLLTHVESLNLSHNNISVIQHLSSLPALRNLDLSFNSFCFVDQLHTMLGNVVTLSLGSNHLETLQGFYKLYSLVTLDLNNNRISLVSEIGHLIGLPYLENLNLTGNPVTTVVDYRNKVLEQFDGRFTEICLDNEKPSEKELDMVAILQALRASKDHPARVDGSTHTVGQHA